jgi:hypothetical protein
MESAGSAPCVLHLDIRWRSLVTFTLCTLLPEKVPRYPLDRRLDGPKSRSGHGGKDKENTFTIGNRTPVDIKVDVTWIGFNDVNLTEVARNCIQWRDFILLMFNLRVMLLKGINSN